MNSSDYTVIVLRSEGDKEEVESLFNSRGFNLIFLPIIKILEVNRQEILDKVKKVNNNYYSWLIFTSANSIKGLAPYLKELPPDIKIASQGIKTDKVLKEIFKRESDYIPEKYISENLAEGLLNKLDKNDKVFLPISKKSRNVISKCFQEHSIFCDETFIYDIVANQALDLSPLDKLDSNKTIFMFFSPSGVDALDSLYPNFIKRFSNSPIFSLGPITSQKVRELDFTNIIEAKNNTSESLLSEFERFTNNSI